MPRSTLGMPGVGHVVCRRESRCVSGQLAGRVGLRRCRVGYFLSPSRDFLTYFLFLFLSFHRSFMVGRRIVGVDLLFRIPFFDGSKRRRSVSLLLGGHTKADKFGRFRRRSCRFNLARVWISLSPSLSLGFLYVFSFLFASLEVFDRRALAEVGNCVW